MIPTLALYFVIAHSAAPLLASDVLEVPSAAGKYDYLISDSKLNRIIGAHAGVGGLSVLDVKTKAIKELAGPKCNGVAVDRKSNRILAAGPDKKLVAYDRTTLEMVGSVDLDGPGDAINMNATNGKLYVCEDDGTHVWVFDPATLKKEATVDIKGAPEWIQYDKKTNKVYQNLKEPNMMQVIDPDAQKVVADWPLTELQSPHGMAIDGKDGKAFSAGKNGLLAVIDLSTGKVTGTAPIAKGVDQIAYDSKLKRVYCACAGAISVLSFDGTTLKSLGDVPSPKGVHTLAIDSATHDVWVAYADASHSYMARFTVPAEMLGGASE